MSGLRARNELCALPFAAAPARPPLTLAPLPPMAETGPTAEEVETFLYLSGVHDADVADLGQTGALQRLCRSTAEFSALRRTMYLPGARDRGDEALRNFRQLREIMRARRQRHWAAVASSLAPALHGVPALRASNALVRRQVSRPTRAFHCLLVCGAQVHVPDCGGDTLYGTRPRSACRSHLAAQHSRAGLAPPSARAT